jgi:hypothetical protein
MDLRGVCSVVNANSYLCQASLTTLDMTCCVQCIHTVGIAWRLSSFVLPRADARTRLLGNQAVIILLL